MLGHGATATVKLIYGSYCHPLAGFSFAGKLDRACARGSGSSLLRSVEVTCTVSCLEWGDRAGRQSATCGNDSLPMCTPSGMLIMLYGARIPRYKSRFQQPQQPLAVRDGRRGTGEGDKLGGNWLAMLIENLSPKIRPLFPPH